MQNAALYVLTREISEVRIIYERAERMKTSHADFILTENIHADAKGSISRVHDLSSKISYTADRGYVYIRVYMYMYLSQRPRSMLARVPARKFDRGNLSRRRGETDISAKTSPLDDDDDSFGFSSAHARESILPDRVYSRSSRSGDAAAA